DADDHHHDDEFDQAERPTDSRTQHGRASRSMNRAPPGDAPGPRLYRSNRPHPRPAGRPRETTRGPLAPGGPLIGRWQIPSGRIAAPGGLAADLAWAIRRMW